MKLINLEKESTVFKSGVCRTKFEHKFSFLYLLSLIMCESVGQIIAMTLCLMHQGIFRPNYIFNEGDYFLDFRAQKFPLTFLNVIPFTIYKPCILGF